MHYYKRNIGDYAKKAGKLSMLQHGSYTLLIDACYDREKFPTMDEALDWCWATTPEEIAAVQFVLTKFFSLEDGRYTQTRILEEIQEYQGKCKTNQDIAFERERAKKDRKANETSTIRAPDVNESAPNQEPRTNNHEPVTSNQDKPKPAKPPAGLSASDLVAMGVDEQVAIDFLLIRKAKRAPLSKTALKGIQKEAEDAGITLSAALAACAVRGWQSFKAEWHTQPNGQTQQPQQQTGYKEYRPK